jgi:hypothetical protein
MQKQINDLALARDGTKARDFYWRHNEFLAYVEPGDTKTLPVNLVLDFSVYGTVRSLS